jgi:serine/threonine protein kinase
MFKRGFSFAPGYRLESFLGRGQFGQVWRASAPGGAAAAIKFIDLSGGEGAKEHEGIKRVKQIRHANLMPITAIWLLDQHGQAIDEAPTISQETAHLKFDPLATADSLPTGPAFDSSHQGSVSNPTVMNAEQTIREAPINPEDEPAWLAVAMLLGGKSLQQRLRECVKSGLPGIPPKELLAYVDESAKGLDFLNLPQHDLGEGMVAIQHCDVKPANIVLLGSSAVVCDFGLARILSRNQVTATSAAGTPAYMAPEAIAGRPAKSSDQYSLAVTYYHLRTGTLPVGEGTLWEILDAHKSGKLDLSRVPEHEQAVLKKATSLDWEQRFESNGDFVDSLREALRAEGHTKHVLMPSGSGVAAPAILPAILPATLPTTSPTAMPTTAIDPSMTLMPGRDITTPNVVHESQDVRATNSATVRNLVAEKTVIDIHSESVKAEAAKPKAWWQQPKWIASSVAATLIPLMIFGSLLSGGNATEEGQPNEVDVVDSNTNDSRVADVPTTVVPESDAALDPALLTIEPLLLTGHKNDVRELVFAGDGQRLISVADDPAPFAWSLADVVNQRMGEQTGAPIQHRPCVGPTAVLETIAVDPSGTYFAMADFDNHLVVGQFADVTQPLKTWESSNGALLSLAWNPDSTFVIAATDQPSILLSSRDSNRDNSTFPFELKDPVKSIAVDPLGQWLLMLGENGVVSSVPWSDIELMMKSSSAPIPTPITSEGTRVTVMAATHGDSKDSVALVTGGEDGDVTLWPLGDKTIPQRQAIHQQPVSTIAVSSKGLNGAIASGDLGGMVGIWRADSQKPIIKLQAHSGLISSLEMSEDGRWLAAASYDGAVSLFDLSKDEVSVTKLEAGAGPANCVRMDRSGRFIAVGHAEGIVALWDLRHAKLLSGKQVTQDSTEPMKKASPKTAGEAI